jgi:PBP1b-binding outer membrane lipoprotein LpoB
MKHIQWFILLIMIFSSCSQKEEKKESRVIGSKFIKSSNDGLKRDFQNLYLISKVDTVLDSAQVLNLKVTQITRGKKVELTSEVFIVEFSDSEKLRLRLDFYTNLDSLSLGAFEQSFNDREFMGEVSSKIKIGKFYCELFFQDEKKSKRGYFLKLLEISLLKNYIEQVVE